MTLTAQLGLRHRRSVTLALGFGTTQDQAVRVARAAAWQRFGEAWQRYEHQWWRYDGGLRRPSPSLGPAAVREYYASVNVVKASEDKTFPGAIAAGLASPWGQSVPAGNLTGGEPTYFGSYREVFARDLYEAFTGLLVAGDVQTARAATYFLFERQQQPDGSMPRNSLENGKPAPDTGGLQLDESSYPILMDWQSGLAGDATLYHDHVIPAADFLVAHGPSDGVGALGGAERLLAVDDRGRDRGADGRRARSRASTTTRRMPGSTRRPPTTSPATSRRGP